MTKPQVYTYYDPIGDVDVVNSLKLVLLWREAWSAKGFEPVVLNEFIARKHPLFPDYESAISKLPSVNPVGYDRACFMRWLALAEVCGKYMADYDVFPSLDFVFGAAGCFSEHNDAVLSIFQTPCCPALVICNNPKLVCQKIIEDGGRLGNRPQEDHPHYSDMYFFESSHMEKCDWIAVHDVLKLWGDLGWQEAKFLHFANCVMGKHQPRWKAIPQLLAALEDERESTKRNAVPAA